MPLDLNDSRVQLSLLFATAIQRFTMQRSMTVEEIVESLTFTAGHALAQKAAKKFATEKELRERAIASLDKGIREGNAGDGQRPQIILPN